MPNIKTLNEMGHLNSSGFGKPWPRHGLYLLHWFSHKYVIFDNNGDLMTLYNPERNEFGFSLFNNRLECDSHCYQLLPKQNFPYYEVGNLNKPGAEDLPEDVRQNYKGNHDESNMDRIIISLHHSSVLYVYVTQHEDLRTFDRQNTYRISRGLVKLIRNLELEELLRQAGYLVPRPNVSQPDRVNVNRPSAMSPMTTPSRESMIDMSHDMLTQNQVSVNIAESRDYHRRERQCCVIL